MRKQEAQLSQRTMSVEIVKRYTTVRKTPFEKGFQSLHLKSDLQNNDFKITQGHRNCLYSVGRTSLIIDL